MLLKQEVLHNMHKLPMHVCVRFCWRERERQVPRLLKMSTIAWASVWSDVHRQSQVMVRTVEGNFLLPHRGKGIQQHPSVPGKKKKKVSYEAEGRSTE